MTEIRLREFIPLLGSSRVSGMAQEVGLHWPPPPPISVRDLVKRGFTGLEVMPVEVAGSPKFPLFKDFSTERVCQLTGSHDPEGIPILNNCAAAGIAGTDLGIVVDHDTGDRRLYFFFGDTSVTDDVDDFPVDGDCMARTSAWEPGQFGPQLEFLHDVEDDEPVPRACNIPGMTQGAFEVPTGGFSHAGKLYLFATTDHYTDTPITIDLGKDHNYMGSSVLAAASSWRDDFIIVAGHEEISSRKHEASGGFKFINIAPWKIRNDDWRHLPDNAVPGGEGLFLIGSGRYRESRPCLAYVPLPPEHDPVFSQWRYLSGYTRRSFQSGPCGTPLWSARQQDAAFIWDDEQFFPSSAGRVPQNKGVVGELSIAFLPPLRLWIALYAGGKARTASHPWGPWSDPIDLFLRSRDHATEPADPLPHYINSDGATYGPYIVPRFTKYEPVTGDTTIYYAISTWSPYQTILLRTTVRLAFEYRVLFQCAERPVQ